MAFESLMEVFSLPLDPKSLFNNNPEAREKFTSDDEAFEALHVQPLFTLRREGLTGMTFLAPGIFAVAGPDCVIVFSEQEMTALAVGDEGPSPLDEAEAQRRLGRAARHSISTFTRDINLQEHAELLLYKIPGVILVIPCNDSRGISVLPDLPNGQHRVVLCEHDGTWANGSRGRAALWVVEEDWTGATFVPFAEDASFYYPQDLAVVKSPTDQGKDHSWVIVADGANEKLVVLGVESNKVLHTVDNKHGWPWNVMSVTTPDAALEKGQVFVAVSSDRAIHVVELPSGREVALLCPLSDNRLSLAVDLAGNVLGKVTTGDRRLFLRTGDESWETYVCKRDTISEIKQFAFDPFDNRIIAVVESTVAGYLVKSGFGNASTDVEYCVAVGGGSRIKSAAKR